MITNVIVTPLGNGRYFAVAQQLNPKLDNRQVVREAGVIRNTEAAARAVARLDLFLASLPRVYVPND